jgi:hypothetical protein
MSNIRVEETIFDEVKQEVLESTTFAMDYVELFLIMCIVVTTFRSLRQYLYKKTNSKIK